MKWILRYRRSILLAALLIVSVIGMGQSKSRYEWAMLKMLPSAYAYEIYFWGFQALFIAITAYIVLSWAYRKWLAYQQLKQEHAKAELALLRSQLDPHFFFNTLNNLYGLSVEGSKQAPQMILQLSDMMRYTLYEGTAEWVPLHRELEYLRKYIALHELRYHKSVDIDVQVDLGEEETKIAPLLLIVLLENAFKHGVEHLVNHAFLRVNLQAHQQALTFTVENNFDPSEKKGARGIGLQNLRKRLELLYPAKHHLEIQQQKDIFFAQLKLKLA
ncbi:MAG: histidine kinase [Saprospiraceae bacterium]|nr:histidine kinase [Saprospiraceae bacterium]